MRNEFKYKVISTREKISRLKKTIAEMKELKDYELIVKSYEKELKELEKIK